MKICKHGTWLWHLPSCGSVPISEANSSSFTDHMSSMATTIFRKMFLVVIHDIWASSIALWISFAEQLSVAPVSRSLHKNVSSGGQDGPSGMKSWNHSIRMNFGTIFNSQNIRFIQVKSLWLHIYPTLLYYGIFMAEIII